MADIKKLSVPTNPARALRELTRLAENSTTIQTDNTTHKQTEQPTNKQKNNPADTQELRRPRADGRSLRARQQTADTTMVTSLRLAVTTLEQLDEFCWHNRCRKQDVVQAALDLYFAHVADSDAE